jgi:hypothetical protein
MTKYQANTVRGAIINGRPAAALLTKADTAKYDPDA